MHIATQEILKAQCRLKRVKGSEIYSTITFMEVENACMQNHSMHFPEARAC